MAAKTTRQEPHGSRHLILDAALRLAAARGYVGTTMAQVRQATGLPPSSLYWHFANKDALLAEALEHGYTRWQELAPRWEPTPTDDDLRAGLLANLRRTTCDTEAATDWWRMGLMLGIESGPAVGDGPRERFQRIRRQTLAAFELWWAAAVDLPTPHVETLARLTLAAHDGLFVHVRADGCASLDPILGRLADGLASIAESLAEIPPGRRVAQPVRTAKPATPAGSRDRLIAAALEVAAESGYEGASISRICGAAGLPASSVYWHFANKDDLFSAAVDDSYRAWRRSVASWKPPASPVPPAEVTAVVAAKLTRVVASMRRRPPFLRIGLMLLLPDRDAEMPGRDQFLEVRRRSRDDFAAWFRAALGAGSTDHATEMATLLAAVIDGLFFAEALDGAEMPPGATADLLALLVTDTPIRARVMH